MDNDYKPITSQNKYINYKLLSAQVKLLLHSIVLQNIGFMLPLLQNIDSMLNESSIHFEL
jgi:hypothetical protein